ncbi:MAG: hypothetical protein LIO77_02450 [Rikenellaceae bacterium]|nr:hypothetical protein [Rikenellaceae bacterium]
MYARYNELDDEEIGLMAMVSGFLKDRADPDYFSLNYPGEGVAIPYEWKGPRTVKFDVRHMEDIDFDYGDGTLLDYIED